MANPQRQPDTWQEKNHPPARFQRLQRIPSPFVWAPETPARIRVALLGAPSSERIFETLRSTGHQVLRYDSAAKLLENLSHALDVVVIDAGGQPRVAGRALECIRCQEGGIPIVLITPDDSELLADASNHRRRSRGSPTRSSRGCASASRI